MRLLLVSVMHTGTRTFNHFLRGVVQKCSDDRPEGDHSGHRCLKQIHCTSDEMRRIRAEIDAGAVVLAPMRRPEDCWGGFLKRGKTAESFVEMWANLLSLSVDYWLPVDLPSRDTYLDAIRRDFGPLRYDEWIDVGHKHRDYEPAPMPYVQGLDELIARFY